MWREAGDDGGKSKMHQVDRRNPFMVRRVGSLGSAAVEMGWLLNRPLVIVGRPEHDDIGASPTPIRSDRRRIDGLMTATRTTGSCSR